MLRFFRSVSVIIGALGVARCFAQPLPSLQTPCGTAVPTERAYSLRLSSFAPRPQQASGLLLQARINGGPPLHLLLDSGAAHITLDARASAKSAVATVSELYLAGAGGSPSRLARSGVAGVVEVGPLQFRNCRVDMASGGLAGGIDGVMPMSIFGSFLIRLDLSGKTLDLLPYPDSGAIQTAGFAHAVLKNDLLFLRGLLNDELEGHILVDTGASYSAISRRTAHVLKSSPISVVDLRGANGAVNADLIAGGIRFQVAGQNLTAQPVVALDLSAFSALNGVDTIGILGYPDLRSSILTISYRDALVRIDARSNDVISPTLIADERTAGAR